MLHFLTLFSLAVALVQGLVVPELAARDDSAAPAPVALDFTVETSIGNTTVKEFWAQRGGRKFGKRAYSEKINDVNDVSYMLNVHLGSNNQKSYVILDTGSSDLWVPSTDYNPKTSTSAVDTGNAFSIQYVDGTTATGEYYTDKLTFDSGRPVLPQFQFATSSATGPGVFGIADRDQESTSNTYNNLPWALQQAGVTPKASYSLYLGPDHGSGVLILGGIDTAKYSGSLTKYNIDTSQSSLSLDVPTISAGGQSVSDGAPYDLDSGTSLALVSQSTLNFLNGVFNVGSNGLVSCDKPSDQYIAFNFGRNTINVPYTDAVYPNGDGTCSLAFSYNQGYTVLGDIFLRNAYVYYDLTDQTISLAQVKYSSSSHIVAA